MKTAEEWIRIGYTTKQYPTSGEFVQAIQLDAMKEGMRRAADKIGEHKHPKPCSLFEARSSFQQASLSAAESLTEKDL